MVAAERASGWDIVYLYAAAPVQAIVAKCVITAVDQDYQDDPYEEEYWGDQAELDERAEERRWMRLSALEFFDGDKDGPLGLNALRAHGFAKVMGRSRPTRGLLTYLRSFDDDQLGIGDDAAAESAAVDPDEVAELRARADRGDYAVPDQVGSSKVRGSAQRVFADAVKTAYGYRCAVTGISTRAFLVASHIVPWAADPTIRTDPRNGLCLSTLIDRAFDTDHLHIHPDLTISVNWDKIDDDQLASYLAPYDGTKLRTPKSGPGPDPEYLRRRLEMLQTADPTPERGR